MRVQICLTSNYAQEERLPDVGEGRLELLHGQREVVNVLFGFISMLWKERAHNDLNVSIKLNN